MIVINGENRQEMQGKTIEFLLEEMGLKKEQVAVEVNESITDKSLYEKTIINDGDIIAAVIDNSLHLKRIYRDKEHRGLIFKADNPKYSPLILSESEAANINILGKAVAFSSSTI